MSHYPYRPGLELATTFYQEVQHEFKTTNDIADYLGYESVVDMFDFLNTLLAGTSIEISDADAGILQVINRLPGRDHYLKYISVKQPGLEREFNESPKDKWECNDIQFPRLLAEIQATQENLDLQVLAEAMDLNVEDVEEIFDRANTSWESIKRAIYKAAGP